MIGSDNTTSFLQEAKDFVLLESVCFDALRLLLLLLNIFLTPGFDRSAFLRGLCGFSVGVRWVLLSVSVQQLRYSLVRAEKYPVSF